ncbi:uncharacterized protein LOC142322253 isoform X2 [Lycorma delicatula]
MKEQEEEKQSTENTNSVINDSLETEVKQDKFLEMVETMTNAQSSKKEQLNNSLKEGCAALDKKLYRRAINCFTEAVKITDVTSLKGLGLTSVDVAIINYMLNLAKVESDSYEKIVLAIRYMIDNQHLTAAVPAFYYLLGKAYYKLNRFKNAIEPLQKCEEILQNLVPFTTHCWPTTDKIIKETTRDGLEEYVMELLHSCCSCSKKPTAICRFDKCIEISTHIVPSDQIFDSDPDFIGYVSVLCEEKCNVQYHVHCWKAFKETFSSCEKVHDKDMLERPCPTTDCVTTSGAHSKICMIEIIGQDGKIKSQLKADVSQKQAQKQTVSKNSKKRKQKNSEDKVVEKVVRPSKLKRKKPKVEKNKTVADSAATSSAININSSSVSTVNDAAEYLNKRLAVLEELRAINFGCVTENIWNPREPYYGREDEKEKKEKKIFIPPELADEDNTRQYYKDYVFSWFYEVLSKEGPMKIDDIQEQWVSTCRDSDNDDNLFCDIKLVLTDITNVCDLLLETTRFCLIDDYICLSEQLSETYKEAKTELVESVSFMLSNCQQPQPQLSQHQPNETVSSECNSANIPQQSTCEESALVPQPQVGNENNAEVLYFSNSEIDSFDSDICSYGGDSNEEEEEENYIDIDCNVDVSSEEENSDDNNPLFKKDNDVKKNSKNNHESVNDASSECCKVLNNNDNKTSLLDEHLKIINMDEVLSGKISKSCSSQLQPSDVTSDPVSTEKKSDVKTFISSYTQTDENYSSVVEDLENIKIRYACVENVAKELSKRAEQFHEFQTKCLQQIQKLETEKNKLKEQKEKLSKKYELQLAKKEANFMKEKEQINLEKNRAISQYDEINKQMTQLLELTRNRDGERTKLESQILDLQKKRQAAVLSQLEMQYKQCDFIFNAQKKRRDEKVTELEYFLKFEYLPCHSDIIKLIKQWEEFSDKLSKCKTQFNFLYDKLLKMIQSGVDIDVNNLLILGDLIEPDPPSIPVKIVINQLLKFSNINSNNESSISNKEMPAANLNKFSVPSGNVKKKNQDYAVPGTSTGAARKCYGDDAIGYMQLRCESGLYTLKCRDHQENLINTPDEVLKYLLKINNNQNYSDYEGESTENQDVSENKVSELFYGNKKNIKTASGKNYKKLIDNLKNISGTTPTDDEQQSQVVEKPSKKKKKGKSDKLLQQQAHFNISANFDHIPLLMDNPIWGPVNAQSEEEMFDQNDNDGEWQVCVDRKTLREQSVPVFPMLIAGTKIKSHYTRLMERLKRRFPSKTEKELSASVKCVRERNNSSLSGLSMDEIEFRVERLLMEKTSKKTVSMGLEKFGETAWGGGVVTSNTNWQGSSDLMEECVICCEDMGSVNLTTLECNHPFHTECIRQWLKEKSVCPLCNKFTKMPDEFPAL